MRLSHLALSSTLVFACACSPAEPVDHGARAVHWIDTEFQPSTLSRQAQLEEMRRRSALEAPPGAPGVGGPGTGQYL